MIHILTPEYLPQLGGVADYTRAIARALTRAGEQVQVWSPQGTSGDPSDSFVVHPDAGEFSASDLAHLGAQLDAFPGPRRLLVQWVPHAYRYRAMNLGFCWWLLARARRGDIVELIVHEPYLEMLGGSWKQTAAASVHRLMTVVLLRAATRVWMSIPAWEHKLKPYCLGRAVPLVWLPVPSSLGEPDAAQVRQVREKLGVGSGPLLGHLGTYGSLMAPLLSDVLLEILSKKGAPKVLLAGAGSQSFRAQFLAKYPLFGSSMVATGPLAEDELAAHVAACDLLVQPYPDGISSRRTTAMAALSLGVPIVTTKGHLTEPLWALSGSVTLTRVGDAAGMAREVIALLEGPEGRRQLGVAGRELYRRTFDISHTVAALTSAPKRAAA